MGKGEIAGSGPSAVLSLRLVSDVSLLSLILSPLHAPHSEAGFFL